MPENGGRFEGDVSLTLTIEESLDATFRGRRLIPASEVVGREIPEINYYADGLLRPGGRLTLVAQKKMGKSFFALDFGLHLAEGREFFGVTTRPCNVLYVNFEIAEEKLQTRLQELQHVNGFESSRLMAFTIHEGFALDRGTTELDELLDTCRESHAFQVDVLILDPRAKLIRQDENQNAVVRAFCDNVDALMARHEGLAVFIVHHQGKNTTGSGRGSSVYDGWVDTTLKLIPVRWEDGETPSAERKLHIEGRDTEAQILGVKFEYPKYSLAPEVSRMRLSKVQTAKNFIVESIHGSGEMLELDLRLGARAVGHSDYAFHRALNELKEAGSVVEERAPGQGHRKKLRLVERDESGASPL